LNQRAKQNSQNVYEVKACLKLEHESRSLLCSMVWSEI